MNERTKYLSLDGSGVSTVTLYPAGIKVMCKVSDRAKEIEALRQGKGGRQAIGTGIAFTTTGPEEQKLLEDSLAD
jgi:hypothetical protein